MHRGLSSRPRPVCSLLGPCVLRFYCWKLSSLSSSSSSTSSTSSSSVCSMWKNETRGGSFLGERKRFADERGEKLFSRGENLVVKGEPDF